MLATAGEGHRRGARRLRRDAHRLRSFPGRSSRAAEVARRIQRHDGAPTRSLGGRGSRRVHGPNVTGLGRAAVPGRSRAMARFARAAGGAARLDGTARRPRAVRQGSHRRGQPRDPARDGGRGASRDPAGGVLALEDVAEAPYRVDRMLTSLVLGGHFRARRRSSSVASIGACPANRRAHRSTCSRGAHRAPRHPGARRAPFGHGAHNEAFVLGGAARVREAWCTSTARSRA